MRLKCFRQAHENRLPLLGLFLTTGFILLAAIPVSNAQTPTAKLVPSDSEAQDRFGWSVAIHGRTLVASAEQDFKPGGSGVAYVFVHSGGSWIQQAKLTPPDPQPGDAFGSAVALAGNLIAIGATADDTGGGTNAGAVYVFARDDQGTPDDLSDDTWALKAVVTAADGTAFDLFGISVDISGDAMVVGAWGDSVFGNLAGSAYVFRRSGDSWIQEAKLNASDPDVGDRFGVSVAIDGSRLVVGANGDTAFRGAAYVFEKVGSTWEERAKLTASDSAPSAQLGRRVAIQGDTVVAGAAGANSNAGAAYVFRREGTVWTQQVKLVGSDTTANDLLGASVALRGDLLAVGAHQFSKGPGAVYLFKREGNFWAEQQKITAYDGALSDAFGFSVDLDGFQLVTGAPLADTGGVDSGAAYVLVVRTAQGQIESIIEQVENLVEDGTLNPGQGNSLIAKLQAALQLVERGKTSTAINQLEAFIHEVEALVTSGTLPVEVGEALITAAQSVIDQLRG